MKHEDVWRALDTLAAEKGLSPSGLARAAGLDPTTFNRSKRRTRAGLRWPSTESLSRVLQATGASLEAFTALVGGARALTTGRLHQRAGMRHLPMLPLSRLGEAEPFDASGHPAREHWDETEFPQPADLHGYAVRIDSARFEPVFRDGGTLIVFPETPSRPGDRVLLHAGRGLEVSIALVARDGDGPGFRPFDAATGTFSRQPEHADRSHRIVWVAC